MKNEIKSFANVANFLPGQWVFTPTVYENGISSDSADLTRTDGLTFHLSINHYLSKGKMAISLNPPRHKGQFVSLWNDAPATGQTVVPSIKVSETKTCEQIAADIARRLLPDAETYFARVSKLIAGYETHENGKEATMKEVCALAGVAVPTDHYSKATRFNVSIGDFGALGYGEIKVESADSISLELRSMSKEHALKVLAMLADMGALKKGA